jgi:hypothetical protein
MHCGQIAAGLTVVPEGEQDWLCRQVISPRRNFQAFMFEDTPMLVGGYAGLNTYRDDVWIRGASPS